MMTRQALVLVPGLFGFDAFGSGAGRIAYFDEVAARITQYAQWDDRCIVVHKPAPTGPLAWRVKSLFERVASIAEDGIPGVGVMDRIHLVGHSTGGVDIRLLLNPRYSWPGAFRDGRRTAFFEQIGSVVSLSAPQRGTPIARRMRGTMEGAISEMYLLSILGKSGGLQWKKQGALIAHSVLQLFKGQSSPGALAAVASLPPDAAAEVAAFLDNILRDHGLIHDLTPFSMARLNDAIAGDDWPSIRYYVTVSPAPRIRTGLMAGIGLQELQWAIYAASYWAAHPTETEVAPFPAGPWLGGKPATELASGTATDGVVPAASQTLGGAAAGIVAGDHLDVVGHFESKRFRGTTAFKSGANFDDARFDELWRTIARDLVP